MAQTIGNLPMNPWGFTNTRLRTHLGVNCSSYISEGQECIYMEVATETTMDLHISKLIPSCHLAWRCYTWSEQAIRPIGVIMACELYCCLLPQCEALRTCRSGFSNRNKMVLWLGCGGCAVWSLHKKNMRSVRFVVKRRGCCCNLSGGVALIVWFTTNRMYTKNNNMYTCHEHAIIEWSWHVNSIVACCHNAKLSAHATRNFRSQQQ